MKLKNLNKRDAARAIVAMGVFLSVGMKGLKAETKTYTSRQNCERYENLVSFVKASTILHPCNELAYEWGRLRTQIKGCIEQPAGVWSAQVLSTETELRDVFTPGGTLCTATAYQKSIKTVNSTYNITDVASEELTFRPIAEQESEEVTERYGSSVYWKDTEICNIITFRSGTVRKNCRIELGVHGNLLGWIWGKAPY